MDINKLIAHSAKPETGISEPQLLFDHLLQVATLAGEFAEPFHSEQFAEWLGWWHDAGKIRLIIQEFLESGGTKHKNANRDHTSVGILEAIIQSPLLAFNIAGHHGGLSNKTDLFSSRIPKRAKQEPFVSLHQQAQELLKDVPSIKGISPPSFALTALGCEFWIRMLHSALVDADCLDTEAHFDPQKAAMRDITSSMHALWTKFEANRFSFLQNVVESPLNQIRNDIYEACIAAAELPQGIFALTVPTGGGKTRSAMAFSLIHALKHKLRRIIIALPFTSIIEQNADEYRKIFGEEYVLEHHSAITENDKEKNKHDDAGENEKDEFERRNIRLAAENWDAPVIVTTTVQFLESLFSHKNSRIRKLHNIVGSVIILDEVQSLPVPLLKPTLQVLKHLVEAYNVTIVLCTATQPALLKSSYLPDGFDNVMPIIDDAASLFKALERVSYQIELVQKWSFEQLCEKVQAQRQCLVILNTIADALRLTNLLRAEEVPNLYHLSANLCGAHRRNVLRKVCDHLTKEEPVILVSTQVIEAGVDIDFPMLFRVLAPMDSLIQAAGRCNREGKLEKGIVVIFELEEGKTPPGIYTTGTQQTGNSLRHDPNCDLNHPETVTEYFDQLYQISKTDKADIQGMRKDFLYEDVGKTYQLIEDDKVPVVITTFENETTIQRILQNIRHKGKPSKQDWRFLQPYTVGIFRHRIRIFEAEKLCLPIVEGLYEWYGQYDDLLGLQGESNEPTDLIW